MNRTAAHRGVRAYGDHRSQIAEVWRPKGAQGALPVLVLIHGGFWRQPYSRRLMHHLAHAAVGHGWVAYNIEYRRVGMRGGGGWPFTFDDVKKAIDALVEVPDLDFGRVVTCGHSAGGHLALWAASSRGLTRPGLDPSAEQPVRINTAISLAGVVDLDAAARLNVGRRAVSTFMGGGPDKVPERYALGSPAALLPLRVPQLLVHGDADTTVPGSIGAAYVHQAQSVGDDATFVSIEGADHMAMLDPKGQAWQQVEARLETVRAAGSSR